MPPETKPNNMPRYWGPYPIRSAINGHEITRGFYPLWEVQSALNFLQVTCRRKKFFLQ